MELLLLDKSFQAIRVIDQYESLIWTERYSEHGDFEIYESANSELLNVFKKGQYLYLSDSESVMIIEDIKIETDSDSDNHLIVSGRSLESILDRRIVWKKTRLRGNFQNAIKKLLDDSIIDPSNEDRRIDNFRFVYSDDPEIQNLTISKQFTGDNLYDAIKELCDTYQIGFKITLSRDTFGHLIDDNSLDITDEKGAQIITNRPRVFSFELYRGVDRSYDPYDDNIYGHLIDDSSSNILDNNGNTITTVVPSGGSELVPISDPSNLSFVVFSSDLDNIKSSEYLESTKTLKNVTLVAGEEESYSRRNRVVGRAKGLERRELYTDARDIQSELDNGEKMPEKDYYALLDQRGVEKLLENKETTSFEYEVDPYLTYTYKKDYDKGDIVQVINEYGVRAKCRITEIVRSHDPNGFYIYPTFGEYSENISSSSSDHYNGYSDDDDGDSVGYKDYYTTQGIPSGGKKGQVLTKNSNSDYDVSWKDQPKQSSEDSSKNPGVTGVKGKNEKIFRNGNVNLTPANIGAVSTSGDETISGKKTFSGETDLTSLVLGSESALSSWLGFFRDVSVDSKNADNAPVNSNCYIGADSTAATWTNLPSATAGHLLTFGAEDRRAQMYWERNAANNIYIRNQRTGTWSNWKLLTSQVTTPSWTTPTINSSSCTITSGGYYKEGTHVYVTVRLKLASSLNSNTDLVLFTGMPVATPNNAPLSIIVNNTSTGIAWVNSNGQLTIRRSAQTTSSNEIYINGHYTTSS